MEADFPLLNRGGTQQLRSTEGNVADVAPWAVLVLAVWLQATWLRMETQVGLSVCRGVRPWNPATVLGEARAPWRGHVWVFEPAAGINHLMCEEASLWKIPAPSLGLPNPTPSSHTPALGEGSRHTLCTVPCPYGRA